MATFATTNELKTIQAKALVSYLTNVTTGSCYLMVSKGNAYTGDDTIPDPLPLTDTASALDIANPLFFKKINLAGTDSYIKYIVPDPAGTIAIYTQRYREVVAANIFTEGVRHLLFEVKIPANDILVTDTIRGFNIVVDLITTSLTLATGDSYLASEIALSNTTGNRLIYLENKPTYQRIQSESGELVQIVFAI